MKKISRYRPMIRSRHPSHNILRAKNKNIPTLPYRSVVRFGSSTNIKDTISNGGSRIEINSIDSIKKSASKLLMKQCFTKAGVKTAPWWVYKEENTFLNQELNETISIQELPYPIVAKHHYGSKGKGNTLINSKDDFVEWMVGKTLYNYIYEKFINYALEYRLHVTKEGCFYTCRKALKKDVSKEEKWRRHDDNCVWFLEENVEFKKPNSWKNIENDCIKALKEIGADLLSFDVKVQNSHNKDGELRDFQEYILLESNSASSMDNGTGELSICAKKYIDIIPKIIIKKYKEIYGHY